jgi:hypothetical protein
MADTNVQVRRTPDDIAGQVPEVIKARQEIVETQSKEIEARNKAGINPLGVPQSTFPEGMRQGIHGMINRMVDFNTVTRSVEGPATGIGPGRVVSAARSWASSASRFSTRPTSAPSALRCRWIIRRST